MLLNIDVERIANKEVNHMIDAIGGNIPVNDTERKLLAEQFTDKFTEDQDSLENLVESLLLKNLDETASDMISTAKGLAKLFGGMNND